MHIEHKSEVGQVYEVFSLPLHHGAHLLSAGTYGTPLQPRHPQGGLLVGKFCLKWDLGIRVPAARFSGCKGRTGGGGGQESSVFSGKGELAYERERMQQLLRNP